MKSGRGTSEGYRIGVGREHAATTEERESAAVGRDNERSPHSTGRGADKRHVGCSERTRLVVEVEIRADDPAVEGRGEAGGSWRQGCNPQFRCAGDGDRELFFSG